MFYENSTYMNFYSFNQTDNTVFVDMGAEYKPSEATEITWFASLGYWKTIKNEPLYPDDYPLDVTQSMSSDTGARKGLKLNTDVPDGIYNYYFNIYDKLKNFEYEIKNHRLVKINELNVGNYPDNESIHIGYNNGFNIGFNVLPRKLFDKPLTLTVQQNNATDLPTDLTVCRHDKQDIKTDMTVYSRTDLKTNLSVINKERGIPINLIVKRFGYLDFEIKDFVVQRKEITQRKTDIIVKVTEETKLPVTMTVSVYEATKLKTKLVVAVTVDDKKSLPTKINVQRVERSNLPTTLIVKRICDNITTYIKLLVQQKENNQLPTNMQVIGWNNKSDKNSNLPISLDIIPIPQNKNGINILLNVKNYINNNLPITLTVDNPHYSFEQIVSFSKYHYYDDTILPITLNVFNPIKQQIPMEMYVVNKYFFESIANIIHKDITKVLPTTIDVIGHETYLLPTTLVVNRKAKLQTTGYITPYKHYVNEKTIPITLTVCNTDRDFIPIYMNVISTPAKLETVAEMFAIEGRPKDLKTTLTVKRTSKNELPTALNVIKVFKQLKATSVFSHRVMVDKETTLEVTYSGSSNLPINMFVNGRGSFENNITIINKVPNDLYTFLAIPNINQIRTDMFVSTERIAPVIKAHAKIGLPQLAKKRIFATKDSYIYNMKRLMNFGQKPRIVIGNTKKYDVISTLLGFDFAELNIDRDKKDAQYYGYQTVQKAILHLNVESALQTGDIIKVYSISNNWSENTINYTKFEKVKKLAYITEVKAPSKTGRLNIDITKDLLDFENLTSTVRSYYLEIEKRNKKSTSIMEISSMQTKLGDMAKPSITVTYYHTPKNVDWVDYPTTLEVNPNTNLPTSIFVVQPAESRIPTNISVKSEDVTLTTTKITLEVVQDHHPTDLPTYLDIIKYNCDELGTKINLYIPSTRVINDTFRITLFVNRDPEKEMYVYLL